MSEQEGYPWCDACADMKTDQWGKKCIACKDRCGSCDEAFFDSYGKMDHTSKVCHENLVNLRFRLEKELTTLRKRVEELEKDVRFHSREALASQGHFDGMLLERQNETERADLHRTALEEVAKWHQHFEGETKCTPNCPACIANAAIAGTSEQVPTKKDCGTCGGSGKVKQDTGGQQPWGEFIDEVVDCPDCKDCPCPDCWSCIKNEEHNWNDGECNDCGIRDPLFEGLTNAPDFCTTCHGTGRREG